MAQEVPERLTVSTDCCSCNDGMPTVAIEQSLREFLAAHPEGIVASYLFGSVARGTAGTMAIRRVWGRP